MVGKQVVRGSRCFQQKVKSKKERWTDFIGKGKRKVSDRRAPPHLSLFGDYIRARGEAIINADQVRSL